MVQCIGCNRHHRPEEASCPFCKREGIARQAMNLVGGTVTFLVLAACYGGPGGPPPPLPTGDTGTNANDMDGDGYDAAEDCNDNNSAINPGAVEDCADGVDNDCDGAIDDEDDQCP